MSGVCAMRAREQRRKVMIQARMRSGATWSDACILNLSSRGMLVRAGQAPGRGSYLEIRRGPHVIVARVVWASSDRFGVQTQDPVPANRLLLDPDKAPTASDSGVPAYERRAAPRSAEARHEDSRRKSSAIEFGTFLLLGAVATLVIGHAVGDVLAEPLSTVNAALAAK